MIIFAKSLIILFWKEEQLPLYLWTTLSRVSYLAHVHWKLRHNFSSVCMWNCWACNMVMWGYNLGGFWLINEITFVERTCIFLCFCRFLLSWAFHAPTLCLRWWYMAENPTPIRTFPAPFSLDWTGSGMLFYLWKFIPPRSICISSITGLCDITFFCSWGEWLRGRIFTTNNAIDDGYNENIIQ